MMTFRIGTLELKEVLCSVRSAGQPALVSWSKPCEPSSALWCLSTAVYPVPLGPRRVCELSSHSTRWSQETEEDLRGFKCQVRASGYQSNSFPDPGTYSCYVVNSSWRNWGVCTYSQFLFVLLIFQSVPNSQRVKVLGTWSLSTFCFSLYYCRIFWNSYKIY